MALAPKPVVLTQVETADYHSTYAPEPLVVVGDLPTGAIPAASASVVGGVKRGVAVANITPATDGMTAGTALNALLASLRSAGVIAP